MVPCSPDWDEAYLAAMAEDEYPGDADLYGDPDNAPPAGTGQLVTCTGVPEVAGVATAVADEGSAVAEVAAGTGAVAVAAADGWAGEDEPGTGRDPPPHPAIRTAASTEPIANGDRILTPALSPLRRRARKHGRDNLRLAGVSSGPGASFSL